MSTVLSTGHVVMYGRENMHISPAFYIYSTNGDLKRKIPHVCGHEDGIFIEAVTIQGQEYLCASCINEKCDKIYAVCLRDDRVHVAYKKDGHYPSNICLGEPGVLYVKDCMAEYDQPVLQLDCSRLPFTHTRTIQSGMEGMYDICYSSHPQPGVLIFTNHPTHNIRAVSVDTGTKLWELTKSEIEGRVICPHGITVSTVNNYLIVCDGTNKRLLVLRTRDGKVINTHHVDNCFAAHDPHLINNETQLVLRYAHSTIDYYHIGLFQLK